MQAVDAEPWPLKLETPKEVVERWEAAYRRFGGFLLDLFRRSHPDIHCKCVGMPVGDLKEDASKLKWRIACAMNTDDSAAFFEELYSLERRQVEMAKQMELLKAHVTEIEQARIAVLARKAVDAKHAVNKDPNDVATTEVDTDSCADLDSMPAHGNNMEVDSVVCLS